MKYLYTPFDIAVYFSWANLTILEEHSVLMTLWGQRETLIALDYRKDKKYFINSVKHELHKIEGTLDCTDELNLILRELGSKFSLDSTNYEQDVIESYFKTIKLRLTFTPNDTFYKIKLRNLIKIFGYERRTASLVDYINKTIISLNLKVYLRGKKPCDVGTVSLDEIIIIRLK